MNLKGKMQKSTNLKRNKITMKEVKKQVKGITLIALVVTIIVLLILAGVAISLTIGQNGIFIRAEIAANTWKSAETNEQLAMGELEDWMDEYLPKPPEPISETESFVGYYADTDGDREADGIIFVDLADTEHTSGRWNDDTSGRSDYEYTPVTEGLKQYTMCSESYTGFNGQWTQPVLTAIDNTGAERFYVMALEDFNSGTSYTNSWDYNYDYDYGIETTYKDLNSDSGKENTKRSLKKLENYSYVDEDCVWRVIQTAVGDKENPKWFVPSKTEWSAFGDCVYTKLGVNTDNYRDYGFSGYWSSSYDDGGAGSAYTAMFPNGSISGADVDKYYSVRLATTF